MFVEKYKIKDKETGVYYTEANEELVFEDKKLAEEKVEQINKENNGKYIVDSFIENETF